ncbi:MAG: hypothetical protein RIR62_346 [Pseudomonadota bacterium]|jgi:hypothetical protein
MKIRLIAALAVALSAALPALADTEVDAAVKEKLTAQLVAQGYEVRKIEAEDGLIEVYVVKDGKTASLWFNDKLEAVEHDGDDD